MLYLYTQITKELYQNMHANSISHLANTISNHAKAVSKLANSINDLADRDGKLA